MVNLLSICVLPDYIHPAKSQLNNDIPQKQI